MCPSRAEGAVDDATLVQTPVGKSKRWVSFFTGSRGTFSPPNTTHVSLLFTHAIVCEEREIGTSPCCGQVFHTGMLFKLFPRLFLLGCLVMGILMMGFFNVLL